jgi:N-acetylglucosamine-6-phosphate deacetylase
MLLRAHHYRTAQLIDVDCVDGRIANVGPATSRPADVQAEWVAPAFLDVQINGADGISFNSQTLKADEIRRVLLRCRRHGIAQLCPTLVTASFEALLHGFRTIRQACEQDAELARAIVGIHLEGPYISADDGPRGAHPRQHVRPPDWYEFNRFQDAAGGMIRMLTVAPETPGAVAFIEKVAASGVVVALGHTGADGPCLRDAVRAGARISTHLGNGSHAVLPRHENYLWEQLANDGLWASMIADGHHLPATVMRCILRVKTPARLILTCDSSSLAGLPPGKYRQWEQDFEILPVGKIVVAETPYLAGSWAFTDQCIGNTLKLAETSLADAIDMASNQPRHLLALPARRVEAGDPAELVLFDWSATRPFALRATMVGADIVECV